MKHGVAFRKLSRDTSHRMLMLRNMVTSLLEHEQIQTTLPKARETARLAEKVITLGKKGDRNAQQRASAFLLNPSLIPKVFDDLARRYSERPGGYTRIHKYGHRKGDNAPTAILELVDNPRDLRFEMTARAAGMEILRERLKKEGPEEIVNNALARTRQTLESERKITPEEPRGVLRPMTRWNLQKVLRFRAKSASVDMSRKVGTYMDDLLATPTVFLEGFSGRLREPRPQEGQIQPGDSRSVLDIARGALGHRKRPTKGVVLDSQSVYSQKETRT